MRFSITFLALLPAAILAAPIENLDHLIPNSWIVRLRPDADVTSVLAQARGALSISEAIVAERTYNFGDFRAFSIKGSEALMTSLLAVAGIESFEPDQVVTISQDTRNFQYNAPYNLARVANRQRGSTTYSWSSIQGYGQVVYVLDTGVYGDHKEFANYANQEAAERRVSQGPNFSSDPDMQDYHGHGTHVAATVAGVTTGVSKWAQIVSVKVLGANGGGTLSGILAGIDWVVNNAGACYSNPCTRAVANLSLETLSVVQSLNDAVNNAVNQGIVMVVAAGNSNQDARNQSPASAANACTVGAIDENDRRSSFSNYGSLVDLFAPGNNVVSASPAGPNSYQSMSGTSMASPHVAGMAVNTFLFRNDGKKDFAASTVCADLRNIATANSIANAGSGSPNLLLYNGLGTGASPGKRGEATA